MIVYIDEFGKEHYSIPSRWNNTTPVNLDFLKRMYGWKEEVREDPVPENEPEQEQEHIYSKLKVMSKLKFLGLWTDVRLMLESADLWDDWQSCSDLRMSYSPFATMCEQAESILPDGMTIDEFLAGCEDTEKEVTVYAHRP